MQNISSGNRAGLFAPVSLRKVALATGLAAILAGSATTSQSQSIPFLPYEMVETGVNEPYVTPPVTGRTPLERQPDRLQGFQTGNLLPAGTLKLHVGTHQTDPGGPTSGTGNQVYYGGVDWGVNSWLQLGASVQHFEDPPGFPIGGAYPPIMFQSVAVNAKVQLFRGERLSIAAAASAERVLFGSSLFLSRGNLSSLHIVPSVFLPISFAVTPTLQVHLTPGVSIFRNAINGIPFYGTIPSVGVGASWQVSRRLTTYATVNVPFGPGGNTISSTATITRVPVWTVGARYNVTPKAAVELYATNGFGSTPATNILTHFPGGNIPMFGAKLIYTPGNGPGYRPNYRGFSGTPATPRQLDLQQDGFTLASADTLSPGSVMRTTMFGGNGNYGGGLAVSPDFDGQVEFAYEDYAFDGSVVGPVRVPNNLPRYMIGAKLRLLDQNNGSPFSLAVRALLGRDAGLVGVIYIEAASSLKLGERLALMLNPKFAAFGSTRRFGAGFGANYAITPDMQLIAEVTPVSGGEPIVWAAGFRYTVPQTDIMVDFQATNAIGRYGHGTMVGQSSTRVALGVSTRMNFRRK